MPGILTQDLRYAARQLRANPGFAAVVVLSFGLGVGANSAIFQLVDAVRLRTVPVKNPQDLVTIDFAKDSSRSGNWSTRSARLTSVLWDQVRGLKEPFAATIAWSAMRFNVAPGGEARYAEGQYVSGDFFRVLGVQPWIGRTFTADDDRAGCGTPGAVVSYAFWQRELGGDTGALGRERSLDGRRFAVIGVTPAQFFGVEVGRGRTFTADDDRAGCGTPGAVVSYAFWQRELGGDPGALGRELSLDGRRFPVIGVTPPQFFGVEVGHRFDVAVPLCSDLNNRAQSRTKWWLSAMGRMKPGWTEKRTDNYMKTVSPAIMEATLPPSYRPDQAKRFLANKLVAEASANGVSGLRRQYESPLSLLLAATGLVLLIA